MQKFAALAFIILSATACSKKSGDGGACGDSIKHLMSLQGDELKGAPPEMKTQMETMMNKVSSAMIKSCTDTKWSKEVTDCLSATKTMEDAKPCEEKLTPAQKTASDEAAKAAMSDMAPPTGAMKKDDMPTAPAPTEGSAAPTPTEGSAAPAPTEGSAADGSAAK